MKPILLGFVFVTLFASSCKKSAPMSMPAPPPGVGGGGGVGGGIYVVSNREQYGHISESGFILAKNEPLSTFSIDVDSAAYSNVRRMLREGRLPPKDAVRVEELVNYFDYDYVEPEIDVPFSATVELSAAPWQDERHLVHIGLKSKAVAKQNLPPNNLVFLIDVSGSMASADKLPLLKRAFALLANELRPQDHVAIVVYAGAAGLVLPPTVGSNKPLIHAALERLRAGGSTAGARGIQLAYQTARDNFISGGNNRVVLATDGDFNVGISSEGALVRMIEREREAGVFLSVLGFGTGNLQDSKMEQLADRGNGHYAYIDTILEARRVLVEQLGATLLTVAKDVKIQVEFNPARVHSYRLVGYENRLLRAEDFNDDKKDAGEIGAGHSVTALYEVVPAGAADVGPDIDPLKYQRRSPTEQGLASEELLTLKVRYKEPDSEESRLMSKPVSDQVQTLADSSRTFRLAAGVAEFGMLLRNSEFKGQASYGSAVELVEGAKGSDPSGRWSELVYLMRTAERLGDQRAEVR